MPKAPGLFAMLEGSRTTYLICIFYMYIFASLSGPYAQCIYIYTYISSYNIYIYTQMYVCFFPSCHGHPAEVRMVSSCPQKIETSSL